MWLWNAVSYILVVQRQRFEFNPHLAAAAAKSAHSAYLPAMRSRNVITVIFLWNSFSSYVLRVKMLFAFQFWNISEIISASIMYTYFFFKRLHLFIFRERERRAKERERNIDVREKHQSVASCRHPNQGLNLQPRHVPKTELAALQFEVWRPINWTTLLRAVYLIIWMWNVKVNNYNRILLFCVH